MIRSNSFALFTGREASGRLTQALRRVTRFHERILVDTGGGFEEFRGELASSEEAVVSLAVDDEGRSLPLVHGFVSEGGRGLRHEVPRGEFAVLDREGDGFLMARDVLGTRPIYHDGKGAIASDHRLLFPAVGTLLEPGTVYSLKGRLRVIKERSLTPRRSSMTIPEAVEILSELLLGAVKDCVGGSKRVAVAFSGGLDSALVALLASRFADVILCCVHTKSARDEKASETAASMLDLELTSSALNAEEIADELRLLDLPFSSSPMDRALWCIYSRSARLARESGAQVMLLGQLADELFGGYSKYAIELEQRGPAAAEELMGRDVAASSSRAFPRDEAACGTWIEPRFPFANEQVAEFALGLPVSYKISAGTRKAILREAAAKLGLPEPLTQGPKKAAQYSSGVLKQIGKLSVI